MRRHTRRETLTDAEISLFVEMATHLHKELMEHARNLKPRGDHYKQITAVSDQLISSIRALTNKEVPWAHPNATAYGSNLVE